MPELRKVLAREVGRCDAPRWRATSKWRRADGHRVSSGNLTVRAFRVQNAGGTSGAITRRGQGIASRMEELLNVVGGMSPPG
jgi:hypothetical protein